MGKSKQSQVKGRITSIKNYLIGLGAEFVKNSEGSNSVYLKLSSDKVRVSDHFSPVGGTLGMNIVIPLNCQSAIVAINGAAMVYNTMGELKSFLKSWVSVVECLQYSKESAMNCDILKKQYELNCITDSIKKEKGRLNGLADKIEKESKKLEKLERAVGFNLGGLSAKQVERITSEVDSFRRQNQKRKPRKDAEASANETKTE